jgi:hypothetical protein
MGNGYRRYRDSLFDTLAGTDAELYTEPTNILQTQHAIYIYRRTVNSYMFWLLIKPVDGLIKSSNMFCF